MDNQKRTVIIGNGFDLDLGFPTSYSSFMKSKMVKGNSHAGLFIMDLIDMCEEKNWIDLELAFRNEIKNYIFGKNKYEPKHINGSWRFLRNNLGEYFHDIFDSKLSAYESMKRDSCAYRFCQRLNEQDEIYTFNYTNPYQIINEKLSVQDVHNKFVYANYGFKDMILGVDKELYDRINNEENLIPLFKEYNNAYKDSDLISRLSQTTELIIWGHSLGITDSDYFREFFNTLSEGNSKCELITIVTKDKQASDNIVGNLKTWDVCLDKLKAKCPIHFLYTESTDESYNRFLSTL